MKRRIAKARTCRALVLTALALPALAQAATPGSGWELSAGVTHRRLLERTDNGSRLLTERGPMLRLELDRELRGESGSALRIEGVSAFGNLDYHGRVQHLTTDSDERDLALGLAWRPLAEANWGAPWLVLQGLQQRRSIASTAAAVGPRETSTLLMAGVRWTASFAAAGWRLSPLAEARISAAHRLKVDFRGVFDSTAFDAGRRRDLRLALDVARPDSPWSLRAQWTGTRQSASDSNALERDGAVVGTVRHPRIRIDDFGLELRRAF